MQQPLPVSVGQALAGLSPDVQNPLDGPDRVGADHLGQVDSVDELGGDPGLTLQRADPDDGGDVGVAQRPGGLGVAVEAGQGLFPLRRTAEQLDRREDLPLGVESLVHVAIRAVSDGPSQLEGTDGLRNVHAASPSGDFRPGPSTGPAWGPVLWSSRASLVSMVVGLGVDLVETRRVERLLDRYPERLIGRLMDPEESADLPAELSHRALALALAVAGKEAGSKALGTGWSQGVFWRDVVVRRGPEPEVILKGHAAEVARRRGSSGRTRTRLATHDDLVIGEVWLLR